MRPPLHSTADERTERRNPLLGGFWAIVEGRMSVVLKIVLTLWLVSMAILAMSAFDVRDFFGLPFWVRWVANGPPIGWTLCLIWDRR